VNTTDKIRAMVAVGKLEPADAEEVLRFAAFLNNAGPRDCTCDKGALDEEGNIIPHAHVPPNTLAYAHGEDVDPEGTEEL
jgi:hypothetical protein